MSQSLNLPIFDQIAHCKNLLIAGMGGGFDLFCGLPIYFELAERNRREGRDQRLHLANYSFTLLEAVKTATRLTDSLVAVNATIADEGRHFVYFPELYLSQWFRQTQGEEVTIWCFEKTGVRPLLENYLALVDHLEIDGILLIDGGVDSLLRGDEAALGTLLEDTVSLVAVNELKNVPTRLLGCIAFGAEQDMLYEQIFHNMAALAKMGAFYGACALTQEMDAYARYEDAVLFAHNQPLQDPSVINASIISSVRGEYGNYHLTKKTAGSTLWISPLMSLYWFYDLAAVARRHLLYDAVRYTDTFSDAWRATLAAKRGLPSRRPTRIPLL